MFRHFAQPQVSLAGQPSHQGSGCLPVSAMREATWCHDAVVNVREPEEAHEEEAYDIFPGVPETIHVQQLAVARICGDCPGERPEQIQNKLPLTELSQDLQDLAFFDQGVEALLHTQPLLAAAHLLLAGAQESPRCSRRGAWASGAPMPSNQQRRVASSCRSEGPASSLQSGGRRCSRPQRPSCRGRHPHLAAAGVCCGPVVRRLLGQEFAVVERLGWGSSFAPDRGVELLPDLLDEGRQVFAAANQNPLSRTRASSWSTLTMSLRNSAA